MTDRFFLTIPVDEELLQRVQIHAGIEGVSKAELGRLALSVYLGKLESELSQKSLHLRRVLGKIGHLSGENEPTNNTGSHHEQL